MTLEVKSLQDYVNELSATVQAIKEEIDMIASGGFMPAGSVYFADLPALIDERYGFVYNIKDAFVTTSDFIEGPGKSYSAGTNVGIVRDEERELKYDVLSSFVDTAAIFGAIELKQSMTLSKEIAGANTVEGALESLDNNIGITIDDELSTTSTNPVQNKVIKSALDAKANTDGKIAEAYSADYAAKAANDAHNNNIANTYATKTELSDGLSGKVNAVAGKGLSSNDYTNEDKDYVDGLPAQLLGKQDTLTFDDTPTDGSNNPVKSNGIYDSEKDIYAAMGEMGAKNLISYPYHQNTKTEYGVTFTNNGDGSVTVSTVNTGATAEATFICHNRLNTEANELRIKNGKYILSGCPQGGSATTYLLTTNRTYNGSSEAMGNEYGSGKVITLNGDDYGADGVNLGISIVVKSGTIITTPITFKPMLRLASDTDSTYQPYAKTNKQLTDDVSLLDSKKTDTDMVAADFDATASYTAGNYCVQDGKLYKFKNNHSGAWSSADVDEVKIAGELSALKSGFINVARGFVITGQTFTIGVSGNVIMGLPSDLYGKTILAISCSNFGTAQIPPYGWAVIPNDNSYVFYGEANTDYTNATIDFVYM